MNHPGFFDTAGPFTLQEVAAATQSEVRGDAARTVIGVQPLSEATPSHLSFFDNRKYLPQLQATQAGACLVSAQFADRVPPGTIALVTKGPYRAFAKALALFYPEAMRSKAAEAGAEERISRSAVIE